MGRRSPAVCLAAYLVGEGGCGHVIGPPALDILGSPRAKLTGFRRAVQGGVGSLGLERMGGREREVVDGRMGVDPDSGRGTICTPWLRGPSSYASHGRA